MQELVGELPERLVVRPAVDLLGRLVPVGDHAAAIPDEDHVVREVEQARLRREALRCRVILQRQQGRDPDCREAHQHAKRGRGDGPQIVRQQIGGYRQGYAASCGDDGVVAPVGLRCEQDRHDVENRHRALERRQHVNQENRKGEDGGPEPQAGAAHG
ncbi:hypothetical protein ACVWW7_007310 [Bradyrhizobium sp. LM6.9]